MTHPLQAAIHTKLLWIVVGWLADRHLTHITYHRKENS